MFLDPAQKVPLYPKRPKPQTLNDTGEEASDHDDGTNMPAGGRGGHEDCGGGAGGPFVCDPSSLEEDTYHGAVWEVREESSAGSVFGRRRERTHFAM